MHRGLRAEMRKRIGMDLSQFVRLKRERVADYVAAAHVAAFTPGPDGTVVAGWRKTCLDTLDPTPLLHELKTRAAEVKTATERRAAERERLQRLLSEAKDPQRVEELKEAVVEAAAIEAHCDMPELPEPSRRRDKRTMPEVSHTALCWILVNCSGVLLVLRSSIGSLAHYSVYYRL